MDNQFPWWWPILQSSLSIATLVVVTKLTWTFAQTKHKVDMMWNVFEQKFERRGDMFLSEREVMRTEIRSRKVPKDNQ